MKLFFLFNNLTKRLIPALIIICCTSPLKSKTYDFNYEINIRQQTGVFSRIYDMQHQTGLHFAINQPYGKYMIRMQRGVRFEQTGYQWEFESYPVLSDRFYSYLSYAWSESAIFTHHRVGAELYTALPFRSEGSLGFRYMDLKTNTASWIFTGSINHYYESFLFIFRPFIVNSDGNFGRTFTASARHYFNEENDYVLLRVGSGVSPDQALLQLGDQNDKDVLLLRSLQAGIDGKYHITRQIIGQLSVDLFQQELPFDPGNYVMNWLFQYGLTYKF